MESYLNRVWLWCGLAILALLGLRYLPELTIWGRHLRPVDLLSEVTRLPSPEPGARDALDAPDASDALGARGADREIDVDSISALAGITDSSGETASGSAWQPVTAGGSASASGTITLSTDGLALPVTPIPIEDYGIEQSAMHGFYQSLREIQQRDESVHIAVFGDSFIEGDLITDHLRERLQAVFGGRGVGFVPLASPMNHSRTTIIERSNGFSYHSAVDTGRTGRMYAIAGQMSVPTAETNQVTYHGIRQNEPLRWFDEVTLLYQTNRNTLFSYRADGGPVREVQLRGDKGLQTFTASLDSAKRIRLTFPQDSALLLHGLNFESGKGVYVDNFSLRGTAGHALFRTSPRLFRHCDSLFNYRLVIVQYGLNVLSYGQTDYSYYAGTLRKLIKHLRAGFPASSILIVGVGDRSERLDGDYLTMRGLHELLDIQRRVSREEGVAFWDLHTAMGGDGSMVRFVNHTPPLANKDFTHINRQGGKIIAGQLAKALFHGYGAAH